MQTPCTRHHDIVTTLQKKPAAQASGDSARLPHSRDCSKPVHNHFLKNLFWTRSSLFTNCSFFWWVLQHCTGFAPLVWGRLRVHRAFIYSNWFVCSVCFCSLLPRLTLLLSFLDILHCLPRVVGVPLEGDKPFTAITTQQLAEARRSGEREGWVFHHTALSVSGWAMTDEITYTLPGHTEANPRLRRESLQAAVSEAYHASWKRYSAASNKNKKDQDAGKPLFRGPRKPYRQHIFVYVFKYKSYICISVWPGTKRVLSTYTHPHNQKWKCAYVYKWTYLYQNCLLSKSPSRRWLGYEQHFSGAKWHNCRRTGPTIVLIWWFDKST